MVFNSNFYWLCLPFFNNQVYFQCRTLLLFILLPIRTFLVTIFYKYGIFLLLTHFLLSGKSFLQSLLILEEFTCFALSCGNSVLSHWYPILYLVCLLHLELDCIAFNNSAYKFYFTNCIKVKYRLKDCSLCF